MLTRYKNRLETDLACFDYADAEVKDRAAEILARFSKEMQDGFLLLRRSSELKRIVGVFQAVLVDFFGKHLAASTAALAEEVIAQSASFEGKAYAYKVTADASPPLPRRVRAPSHGSPGRLRRGSAHLPPRRHCWCAERDETVRFVTDPWVFSMIIGEISEGAYELLCNEQKASSIRRPTGG